MPAISSKSSKFVLIFVLAALVQFAFLLAPWVRPLVDLFSRGMVIASAFSINVINGHAIARGTILRSSVNGFGIELKDGCNGVNVMILLWSAMLAFPGSLAWKLTGLLAGAFAIEGLNFLRFISLFYLGQYNLSWFEFAHLYLWETLIMLDALVVLGFWVRHAPPGSENAHARS